MRDRNAGWLCVLVFAGFAIAASTTGFSVRADESWPDWEQFKQRFVQDDGRVIDRTFDQKSTSEGQSYGLFFALVANDRPRFDAILNWTSQNLAENQLGTRLPGWLWGKKEDGSWGLRDANSAPDGALWIAYSLLEAGRLWHAPVYAATGRKVLDLVARHDIADSPVGKQVLALPVETIDAEKRLPIDPSYIPPFQFRYFAKIDPAGPWAQVLDAYLKLAPRIFDHGIAPDLLRVKANGDVELYPGRGFGSYDAIRVYLWAAMSGSDGLEQLTRLKHFADLTRAKGVPPERIDAATGAAIDRDYSPIGFIAAAIPFANAIGDHSLAESLRGRLEAARAVSKERDSANYYDEAMVLFALGFTDGYYRFDARGELQPRWSRPAKP